MPIIGPGMGPMIAQALAQMAPANSVSDAIMAAQPKNQPAAVQEIPPAPGPDYGPLYNNWQQEKRERLYLMLKDGRKIEAGSGERGAVSVSLKKVAQMLKDAGVGFSDIADIVHNHDLGEAPSAGDTKAYQALLAAGYGGDYHVYTPKTGRVQRVPASLK